MARSAFRSVDFRNARARSIKVLVDSHIIVRTVRELIRTKPLSSYPHFVLNIIRSEKQKHGWNLIMLYKTFIKMRKMCALTLMCSLSQKDEKGYKPGTPSI